VLQALNLVCKVADMGLSKQKQETSVTGKECAALVSGAFFPQQRIQNKAVGAAFGVSSQRSQLMRPL
jgi:hypothetical protein